MKSEKNNFQGKSVTISVHVSTTGPGHDLRDYLLERKVMRLLFIVHPLLFFKENMKYPSTYILYENGKVIKKGTATHVILPEYLLYIKDFFLSIYWTMTIMKRHDLFVGVGNLNALCGVLLKKLGYTKSVIYYVIDFVPRRFGNSLINYLYHWTEKQAALNASRTWNLSPRMISGREEKWKRVFPHQLVVPHGVHSKRIHRVAYNQVNKYELIYMGTLLEKQGIQLVISSLPEMKRKIPGVTFTIIGRGPYERQLRSLVKKYHLEKSVQFLGYIESHAEMENRIAKSSLAVALYDRKSDMFSYYADPGKIKNYLGAGVPVVMTDVPYIAREVVEKGCGLMVSYDKNDFPEKVLTYLMDEKSQRQCRENAVQFAEQFDWEKVFDKAFSYE